MTAHVFVDTNVLVYQLDARNPDKQGRAKAWLDHLWASRTGRISSQVLQEFYVTVTRKMSPGLDREVARKVVQALWAWSPVLTDDRIFVAAWMLQDRFELSWWDSLIVAAAKASQCSHLLTEDLQHGQDLDGLRVVNPFRLSPELLR